MEVPNRDSLMVATVGHFDSKSYNVSSRLLALIVKAAITMVLSQDVGLFPIIHGSKNLGNHSHGIR